MILRHNTNTLSVLNTEIHYKCSRYISWKKDIWQNIVLFPIFFFCPIQCICLCIYSIFMHISLWGHWMTKICGLVVMWDRQAAQVMRLRFMLMFFFFVFLSSSVIYCLWALTVVWPGNTTEKKNITKYNLRFKYRSSS